MEERQQGHGRIDEGAEREDQQRVACCLAVIDASIINKWTPWNFPGIFQQHTSQPFTVHRTGMPLDGLKFSMKMPIQSPEAL
jgi:hypothetical protein